MGLEASSGIEPPICAIADSPHGGSERISSNVLRHSEPSGAQTLPAHWQTTPTAGIRRDGTLCRPTPEARLLKESGTAHTM